MPKRNGRLAQAAPESCAEASGRGRIVANEYDIAVSVALAPISACLALALVACCEHCGRCAARSTLSPVDRRQVERAEAVVAHACDLIRDRYGFYTTGWSGPAPGALDKKIRMDLAGVVGLALARQDGVEGGIWQSEAGPLAYAYHIRGGRTEDRSAVGGDLRLVRLAASAVFLTHLSQEVMGE